MAVIYAGLAVSAVTSDAKVDVVETPDVLQSTSSASVDVDTKEDAGKPENEAAVTTVEISGSAASDDDDTGHSSSTNAEHLDAGSTCFLHLLSNTPQHGVLPAANKSGAVFWKSSWRQHLCKCPTCMVNFVDSSVFIHRIECCSFAILVTLPGPGMH